MIKLKELLGKYEFKDLSKEHQDNILELLEKISKIREAYGKPMTVTSGYRSKEDHLRIYKSKGITDEKKIPMASRHLVGAACDIADPKKELQKWLLANVEVLESTKLWCEDFKYTTNWVHFQICKPNSGKRFFIP